MRRSRAKITLIVAATLLAACGNSESASKVKNAALPAAPVLVNGAFTIVGKGWEPSIGKLVDGCRANKKGPSFMPGEGELQFGVDGAIVSQRVVIPTPGRVTFTIDTRVTRDRQSISIGLRSASQSSPNATGSTGTLSTWVMTQTPGETVTVSITGVVKGLSASTKGCVGPAVKNARLDWISNEQLNTTTSSASPTTTTTSTTSTTSTTTTTPTTTTTIEVSDCVAAKMCRIGDVGPGGGRVIYVASKPQPWGQFIEAAPSGWADSLGSLYQRLDPWVPYGCTQEQGQFPSGSRVGDGKANTAKIVATCVSGPTAAGLASSYRGGGRTDWYLPSKDELDALSVNRFDELNRDYYWSSTASLSQSVIWMLNSQSDRWAEQLTVKLDGSPSNFSISVRPVRSFGPTGAGGVDTSSTITTTPPKPCSATACEVGDRGPGGGIVFYVAPTDQSWGRYLEAAPANWATSDAAAGSYGCDGEFLLDASKLGLGDGYWNSAAVFRTCGAAAARQAIQYSGGDKRNWHLPSRDEAIEMAKHYQLIEGLQLTSLTGLVPCYWTSTQVDKDNALCIRWAESSTSANLGIYTVGKTSRNNRFARPIRAFSAKSLASMPPSK